MTDRLRPPSPQFLPDWPEICARRSRSPEETTTLAQQIAAVLAPGDTLLLAGDLGTGKTHFARAVIRRLIGDDSASEHIPSPSFTLVQAYAAVAPEAEVLHADLYRLSHPDEVVELGLDDGFETAICLVEWPERLAPDWPSGAVLLAFAGDGADENARRIALHAPFPSELGDRLARLLGDDP